MSVAGRRAPVPHLPHRPQPMVQAPRRPPWYPHRHLAPLRACAIFFDNSERSWQEQGFMHVLTVPASEETAASYEIKVGVPGGGTSVLLAEFPECLDNASNKARRKVNEASCVARSNTAVPLADATQGQAQPARAPSPRLRLSA